MSLWIPGSPGKPFKLILPPSPSPHLVVPPTRHEAGLLHTPAVPPATQLMVRTQWRPLRPIGLPGPAAIAEVWVAVVVGVGV